MQTFSIQTLGCKVNQYESEQVATLLRSQGLMQVESATDADLRIVNTCSVTTEAAAKSRQTTRRLVRLPLLRQAPADPEIPQSDDPARPRSGGSSTVSVRESKNREKENSRRGRVIVIGCWATSNKSEAQRQAGVDAVLTHTDDVAGELKRLLSRWRETSEEPSPQGCDTALIAASVPAHAEHLAYSHTLSQGPDRDERSMILRAGTPGECELPDNNKPHTPPRVKQNLQIGARSLPLLDDRHTGHQRAFLKIQDGCDAHCTYCIIPQLRPSLWSKPIDDAVEEARRLVDAGHREIVLTGIFLGAYGQPTAIRRRQPVETGRHFATLIEALCTSVPGLRRLRLSSLEPGDLTTELIAVLRSHEQVVPHFHLPLQSGSDLLLRRMNRQYARDDFLRMIDRVNQAFDRPAITTDIIVGFPCETEAEFAQTLDVVDRAKFIHIHAFPFSPRPGTAASRWKQDFIPVPIARNRIQSLTTRAAACGFAFRSQFLGSEAEILVERTDNARNQHGRCERYFDIHIEHDQILTGRAVRVRIDRVTPTRTFGSIISIEGVAR